LPFLPAGVGAAVAGGVAAGAVGVAGSALLAKGQSGAVSQGQQQANAALAPFSTTGVQADTQSANLLGLNGQPSADAAMKSFQSSPGYQYSVSEALRGVDAGAASRGTLVSGSTIKGEETVASGLANQDFGNYMSRLNSLSNFGITAAGGQASADTSAAGAQSNILGSQGATTINALTGLAGNTNVQNALSSAFKSNGSSGGTDGTGASSAFNEVQTSSPIGNTAANGLQVGGV
jgi:hypothetical protein